jgi:hypothetical protein
MFSVLCNRRAAAIVLAGCAAFFAPAAANAAKLTLINGWLNSASGARPAAAKVVQGVVHFEGAISGGTNDEPFILPASMRPAATVYMKVGLCNAHNGRLYIQPSGDSFIEAEGEDLGEAQCFTSLDGASFAMSPDNYKPLKLKKGWHGYGSTTPAARSVNGVVQFAGAMATSKRNPFAFKLPASMAPSATVYVPLDLCNATNGRLQIGSDGTADVEVETKFSNAKCFTSLDGVQFAPDSTGFTPLTLINGWTNAPFGTRNAAVRISGGIVQFEGAIATTGSSNNPFVLPAGFRPKKTVRVAVDLCNAHNGRLEIDKNGAVYIDAEKHFSSAECFTSLDGVSFVE